ncbi:hypothetical protein [Psychrosphaera sp. 1_MG-2023]|uniref:hypothetical protein n=1 Tax=Psychrosphaera sp. 1_MG-2023 TaxID=3062643 RepID=UPI0026E3D49B|nr:hypothetical protein [Psychrosphaera sp. 1_MG-2023]
MRRRIVITGLLILVLVAIDESIADLAISITNSYQEQPFILSDTALCAKTLSDDIPLCGTDPPTRASNVNFDTNPQCFGHCLGFRNTNFRNFIY